VKTLQGIHGNQKNILLDFATIAVLEQIGQYPETKLSARYKDCMLEPTAEMLKEKLTLTPHPEGGWFREVYRSTESISGEALPGRFSGSRPFSTSIYFLLEHGDFSALHRIKSDELWHFYAGAGLTIHIITPEGNYQRLLLGSDVTTGESFQAMVPAGCWFGAELSADAGFALVGCTVAPGFDFADFEMGVRAVLLQQFPEHENVIRRLTRDVPSFLGTAGRRLNLGPGRQ